MPKALSTPRSSRLNWVIVWAVPALFFAILTLVATWPMARNLGTTTAYDYTDGLLNAWILRWNLHQLPRAPLHLFDASILYPMHNSLALSENLLGLSLLFWPLDLIFHDTLILANSVILFSFFSLALVSYAVFRHWTRSCWIGLMAGIIIGFAPARFPKITHFQLLSYQPTVLAIFFAWRWLRGARRRDAVGLFASVAVQFLFGIYLFVFLAVFLSAFMPLLALPRLKQLCWRRLAVQGVVGALALCVVIYPIYRPYKYIHDVLGIHVQRELRIETSVNVTDFLRFPSSNLLWGKRTARFANPYSRFPWEQEVALPFSFYALVLCGVLSGAVLLARRRRLAGQQLWLAALLAGLLCLSLMFGPRLHLRRGIVEGLPMPFSVYARFFPGFDGIRGTARFILPASIGLAMAGLLPLGWAARAWRRRRPRLTVAALALLTSLLLVESLNRPLYLAPLPSPQNLPPVIGQLSRQTAAPVCFWPMDIAKKYDFFYMYYNSYFWFPMINGRSGYFSDEQLKFVTTLAETFPSRPALALLRRTGVHYLIFIGEFMEPTKRQADLQKMSLLERAGLVRTLFQDAKDNLYIILPDTKSQEPPATP